MVEPDSDRFTGVKTNTPGATQRDRWLDHAADRVMDMHRNNFIPRTRTGICNQYRTLAFSFAEILSRSTVSLPEPKVVQPSPNPNGSSGVFSLKA